MHMCSPDSCDNTTGHYAPPKNNGPGPIQATLHQAFMHNSKAHHFSVCKSKHQRTTEDPKYLQFIVSGDEAMLHLYRH